MSNKKFGGIMPALITPVNEDNTLREEAVRQLVERHLECGVNGFSFVEVRGKALLCLRKPA